MRWPRAAMAMAAMALCAAAAPAERIEGEVRSWGHIQQAWSIDRAGEARYTVREGTDFYRYHLVTRRVQVGAAGFAAIEAVVAPLRDLVGKDQQCRPGATDGPYGVVTWTEANAPVRFGFNSSCVSPMVDAGFVANDRARAQIEAWTKDGEVIERRWMGPPPAPQ